ncbi:SFT2-domain-containing protein [Suhomyces tanzawaensis NRRL Y-17324]|uniref:Protein transport protein SFT2 n=1 Tax=Suhomyces tanzawaensis NRRL Y-17324 TaxID=984487 RepID=A0A1E4SNA4_9ASCO|nr:SFT2-domain-containing protein [Suhomyces tanzawaensis NRRL Y-17324]ODV81001.1 SFT2-domain-containing protein [Suhomyces tanzawaensis NRRL Y-17324]
MSDSENFFRQLFQSWNNRASSGPSTTSRPILSEWTDYVKSSANDLYSALPTSSTSTDSVQEPSWFTLSRFERLIGFIACLAGSIFCFFLSFFLFPVLALRPRKFGLIWSMGSILFLVSFGILQGPRAYVLHLISPTRIVFTGVFVGSVFATLYSAVILKSSLLTIVTSAIEILAVAYYTVSYFPFGATTLTWFTSYIAGYFGGFIGGIL